MLQGGRGWTCELSEAANNKLIEIFAPRPEAGPADYNSTLVGGISPNRGSYNAGLLSAGLFTYAGTSCYSAAGPQNQGWTLTAVHYPHPILARATPTKWSAPTPTPPA
jgi:hypothetical protein